MFDRTTHETTIAWYQFNVFYLNGLSISTVYQTFWLDFQRNTKVFADTKCAPIWRERLSQEKFFVRLRFTAECMSLERYGWSIAEIKLEHPFSKALNSRIQNEKERWQ